MESDKERTAEAPGVLLRVKSLILDWLFICAYLLLVFVVAILFYSLVLDGVPEFTNAQAQLIATLASVIPVIAIFSIMEGSGRFASWGKRRANLKVVYKGRPMQRSVIRNTLKFLPWQFGHMSTINGIYTGFDTPYSVVFLTLSTTLAITYVLMAFFRKDNRHLADILAGSRVVKNLP